MGLLTENTEKAFSLYKERDMKVLSFYAFGTSCKVKFTYPESFDYQLLSKEVVSWVSEFEARYSRYLPNNWISQVNQSAGKNSVKLSQKDIHLLRIASFTFFQSKQTIDPSCLPLTQLWQQAKATNQVPHESQIKKARELVNWMEVKYTDDEIYLPIAGMGLDFGGFGKEFAVDQVALILKDQDCANFLIDFGGDIYTAGKAGTDTLWNIGIEMLGGGENPVHIIHLENKALASSGNYRKFFKLNGNRYGHTIDHRTGYPTIYSELSASVISSSCLKSGIISTACLLIGKEGGFRMINSEWDTEGCIQSLESSLVSNKFYKYLSYENIN
jgi:thiamine biosynthesis lipoprotein